MAKNKNINRNSPSASPYYFLAIDVIIDAFNVATGKSAATEKQKEEAVLWLKGETCRRWTETSTGGLDIQTLMKRSENNE